MRRLVAGVAALVGTAVLGAVLTAGVASAAASAAADQATADRVLVVSFPHLTWQLVDEVQPPVLTSSFPSSALLSVQTAAEETDDEDGYLTVGAGNRAAGVAAPTVPTDAPGGVAVPGLDLLRRHNDDLLYGAEPGALGTALAAAGTWASVVANADVIDAGGRRVPHRAAALAVVDGAGKAGGTVADDLAVSAADAPGGLRVDDQRVLSAFDAAWSDSALVLVEMSDLDRADRVGTEPDLGAALRRSDALLGELLARTTGRDLVLIVAPVAPGDGAELTTFAARGPGFGEGLARSATTRRAGYVTLPDVAPTVLRALGIDAPDAMTGTAITGTSARADRPLPELADRATFRERTVVPVTAAFLGLQLVVYLACTFLFRRRAFSGVLRAGLLAVVAFPVLAFLSGAVHDDALGVAGYVALLTAAAVVAGAGLLLLRRLHPLAPPLAIVGVAWLLMVVDAARGGALQFDTAFGYSPITAARFTGMGNLGFALVMVAAIVVACGWWPAWPGVGLLPALRPRRAPTALLAVAGAGFLVTVVADGLPSAGADLGGVLALVPTLAVTWLLLAGIRVSWWKAVLVGVVAVAVVVVAMLVDLARPADDRTHLGRFAQRIADGDALTIIHRKLDANLHVLSQPLVIAVAVVAAVALVVAWHRSQPFAAVRAGVPGVRATLVGAAVGAVLGLGVNDSGVAVPGMMLAVLVPWFTWLALDVTAQERA